MVRLLWMKRGLFMKIEWVVGDVSIRIELDSEKETDIQLMRTLDSPTFQAAPVAKSTVPPAPVAKSTVPPAPVAKSTVPPAPGAKSTVPPAPGAKSTVPPAPGAKSTVLPVNEITAERLRNEIFDYMVMIESLGQNPRAMLHDCGYEKVTEISSTDLLEVRKVMVQTLSELRG